MFFQAVRSGYQRFRNRRSWERVWRNTGQKQPWMADSPRPFVLRGFEAGWLAPGMKVLEIGCGRGNTAIWLAQHGIQVLGVDVSEQAIQDAHKAFLGQKKLEFKVVDICAPVSFSTTFDVIIDTGCLQHLSSQLRVGYRENILNATRPGSRFVTTMFTKKAPLETHRKEIQSLFTPPFKLVQTEEVPTANTEILSDLNAVFHLTRD